MSILIGLLMIALVAISVFLVFIILMQRGSADGGLGVAMGGGAAESALGADSGDVLSKITTKVTVVFFVLVLGLYLLILVNKDSEEATEEDALPEFAVSEEETAPVAGDALDDIVSDATEEKAAVETDVAEVADGVKAGVEKATGDASVNVDEAAEAVAETTEEATAAAGDK